MTSSTVNLMNDIVSSMLGKIKEWEPQGACLELADAYYELAMAYAGLMQSELSQQYLGKAELMCESLAPDSTLMGDILCQKALVAADQGDYPEAIRLAQRAVEMGRKSLPAWSEDKAARYALLGELLTHTGSHFTAACKSFAAMWRIVEHYGEDAYPSAVPYLDTYAYALLESENPTLVREMIDHLRAITGSGLTGQPEQDAWVLEGMAIEVHYLYKTGDHDGARTALQAALNLIQIGQSSQTLLSTNAVKWMREVMVKLGLDDAVPSLLTVSVDGMEKILPLSDEGNIGRLVSAQFDVALSYMKRGDFANTIAACEIVLAKHNDYLKRNSPLHALILRWMGVCYLGLQDFENAYHQSIASVDVPEQPADLKASGYQFAALCAQVFGKRQVSDLLYEKARSSGALSIEEAHFWGETVLKLSGLSLPDL